MPTLVQAQTERGAIFPAADPSPFHFGEVPAEERAALDAVALFTLPHRRQWHLTGADAVGWLNNFCTADLPKLEVGNGTVAFCTNIKARVLGFPIILRSTDGLWIEIEAPGADDLHTHLDRYIITEDVTITDHSARMISFQLAGPQTEELIRSRFGTELPERDFSHREIESDTGTLRLFRFDGLGIPGVRMMVPEETAAALWTDLAADAVPAGSVTFDTLRVRAGWPAMGTELSTDRLAPEADPRGIAISYTKGCYLGQEPIARIDALGHVNRKLAHVESAGKLEPGCELVLPDGETKVGQLSSTAWMESEGRWYGLGYFKPTLIERGPFARANEPDGEPIKLRACG